jgi:oligoendopeptidase F
MLETLRKALGGKEATKPVETLEIKLDTAEIQAAIQAAVDGVKAEFDEYKQTADAAMADAAAKITGLQGELAEMAVKLTEAKPRSTLLTKKL